MIKRIVKMHFLPQHTDRFLKIFSRSGGRIRAFEGCSYLQLVQDTQNPNIFFTISHWDDERHLEAYRTSALFQATWSETKALFAERAEAWSTVSIEELA